MFAIYLCCVCAVWRCLVLCPCYPHCACDEHLATNAVCVKDHLESGEPMQWTGLVAALGGPSHPEEPKPWLTKQPTSNSEQGASKSPRSPPRAAGAAAGVTTQEADEAYCKVRAVCEASEGIQG